MCCGIRSFPPLEAYAPTKSEIKSTIYGLFASALSSSIVSGLAQGILSVGGHLVSFVCYKAIDYFADAINQGRVSMERLDLFKTIIKVAGTILTVLVSVFVFTYSFETLIVTFGLYMIFSGFLSLINPLPDYLIKIPASA